jgi:hypothetical protein
MPFDFAAFGLQEDSHTDTSLVIVRNACHRFALGIRWAADMSHSLPLDDGRHRGLSTTSFKTALQQTIRAAFGHTMTCASGFLRDILVKPGVPPRGQTTAYLWDPVHTRHNATRPRRHMSQENQELSAL